MYVPPAFSESDPDTLFDFLRAHSFATLVSHDGDEPFASHLPFLFDRAPLAHTLPQGRLLGHMARANPQWQSAHGRRVMVVFQGPHAYVSPTWYEEANVVPTWNYVAVHAYGTLEAIEDRDRLGEIVARTVATYEAGMPTPWRLESQDAGFIDQLLGAIVGFEIPIDRLEGKWKLNQNHSATRRERVARALHDSGSPDGRAIAALMGPK
jgi:transcriptional regulator